MESIKLSIIITVFNREKYIANCIESLLKQDLSNYEIIIIDDGSTDNSKDIIENYIRQYGRKIIYKYKENGGISSARNLGLDISNGEFITYVDSDDYISENVYKGVYEFAKNNNADIVIYDVAQVDGLKKVVNEALKGYNQGEISREEYILSMPSPCNKIIKKEVWDKSKLKFPLGICYEDFATMPALGQYADKIYYYKKVIYNYFQSNNSIMRQDVFKNRYYDIFKAVEVLKNNITDQRYFESLECIVCKNLLVEFSLVFYKFDRYRDIDRIVDIIKIDFPNWEKNRYFKRESKKMIFYAKVFYHKRYKVLKMLQKVKNKILNRV
ncbi:MAG: glycosyltransferase family 2 protein [Clostridia bacterium]|nr:glycosyltransferase family 2 protein [Clostridia bacterium]